MAMPSVVAGVYSVEEVQDFDAPKGGKVEYTSPVPLVPPSGDAVSVDGHARAKAIEIKVVAHEAPAPNPTPPNITGAKAVYIAAKGSPICAGLDTEAEMHGAVQKWAQNLVEHPLEIDGKVTLKALTKDEAAKCVAAIAELNKARAQRANGDLPF